MFYRAEQISGFTEKPFEQVSGLTEKKFNQYEQATGYTLGQMQREARLKLEFEQNFQ
jgi:hypothetical protein